MTPQWKIIISVTIGFFALGYSFFVIVTLLNFHELISDDAFYLSADVAILLILISLLVILIGSMVQIIKSINRK
jgi:hypothetical protein